MVHTCFILDSKQIVELPESAHLETWSFDRFLSHNTVITSRVLNQRNKI